MFFTRSLKAPTSVNFKMPIYRLKQLLNYTQFRHFLLSSALLDQTICLYSFEFVRYNIHLATLCS